MSRQRTWSLTGSAPLSRREPRPERRRADLVRALATSAYIPTFLAEIGVGAMLPLLTLSVLSYDVPAAAASLGIGVYSAGRLVTSGFVGSAVSRLGPMRASMASLVVLGSGAGLAAAAPGLWAFLVAVALVGAGHAALHVSRQARIDDLVASHQRARALTTLAGLWRVANFLGPLAGGAVIAVWGLDAGYAMAVATIGVAMVALVFAPAWRTRHSLGTPRHVPLRSVISHTLPTLRTLGVAVVLTGALRAARNVVIPLWGSHLGLDDHTISYIFGLSAAVDMLLFVPAGYVMDRWGRRWTAVPSALLLAAGTSMLPFTGSPLSLAIAGVVLGLGNGWGSGVLMTLGGDAAPAEGRAEFIGVWMALQDAGGLLGPAVVSAGAAVSFPLGFHLIGGMGVATAGAMARWIPPWRLTGASDPRPTA